VRNLVPSHVSFSYIRQPQPLGLGHAVLCAEPVIGDKPFAVLLADDIIDGGMVGCLEQMMAVYQETGSSVIAVESVSPAETDRYGIVSFAAHPEIPHEISKIVEKPHPSEAPSTWAVTGRYILTPRIFHYLRKMERGKGGEIQLTDAISNLLCDEKFSALPFRGERFDCGSKEGFLKATFAFAMKNPRLKQELEGFFRRLLDEQSVDAG
jgi:UTP--glucose-1-phosphate uridylyltransferase